MRYTKQSTTTTLTAGAGAVQLLAIEDAGRPESPESSVWALPGVATFKLVNTSVVLAATVTLKVQAKADDGAWTDVETLVVPLGIASGITGEQRAAMAVVAECEPANYFGARLTASCTGANVDLSVSWLSFDPVAPMS